MLITDSSTLSDFCSALRGAPYLAVDTEFLREKTYYAELCLVQVAHGEHAAAIDPLAEGIDLSPLRELLCDGSTVKVLHSAVQDLEIFLQGMGQIPGPVFDTQIAAAFCGHGDQPGYATLAANLLDVKLDKASQTVDWSVRPLSDRQIAYALGDVTHLCRIYELLTAELERQGRAEWVAQDMAALLEPTRYRVLPREAYHRIKLRRAKSRDLAVLRELAAWREETAMERNIPRNWVLRDEALAEIALHRPKHREALARVRGLKPQVAQGGDGQALLDAVARALGTPEGDWPIVPERHAPLSGHESLVALLQALLQLRCEEHGVSKGMVAKRSDLDRIATEPEPDVAALSGWRHEIFGADALELRAGRLALTGDGGGVSTVSS
ncbi:MAG: ribonuclease D [Planctomycetota bacterium]|nr:ribonuclease D [Planctomycetota bacterium]